MEVTVNDLLSRFPWLAGLQEEYLQAVLNDSMNCYSDQLFRYKDIVLLKAADTIQTEQAGVIQDVKMGTSNQSTKQDNRYFRSQLEELLRQEGIGLLWI